MLLKIKKLFLLPFILFFFLSIGLVIFLGGRYLLNTFKTDPHFVVGFPQEASPARDAFLLHMSSKPLQHLIHQKNHNVYFAQFTRERPNLQYYSYPQKELGLFLELAANYPKEQKQLNRLPEDLDERIREHPIDGVEIGFPTIDIDEQSTMHIETEFGAESIPMTEFLGSYGKAVDEFFRVYIFHANDDAFVMTFSFEGGDSGFDVYYVFMKKDFSEFVAVDYASYPEFILSGELSEYEDLIFGEELNERFTLINGSDGVYDAKKKTISFVDDKDKLSIDGKLVYLKGGEDDLKGGKQRIQRTEDYFSSSRKKYATFDLEKGEVSKRLDFRAFSYQGDARILYFAEDYIVYYYSYKGFITGKAGSTNVIVDLQEDQEKPTFYLNDLGIQSPVDGWR